MSLTIVAAGWNLLQLIRHLGDAGLAACLFLRPTIRGATETDAADGLFADLDRKRRPAAE
jgi:hypothetical protein